MMQLDRSSLGRMAKELGFVRDTLEKVCRLTDILKFFETDELLSAALALKGGTAINLTIFDLPRLSVDIDLDYCRSIDRDDMLSDRELITNKISKYMTANGYVLSLKSKNYHALDSFVYDYTNGGGVKDNLKIEINYMLRSHVLPVEIRNVKLPWDDSVSVLSLNPVEIFASKTVALLTRTAPRDLYDLYNMVRFNVLTDDVKGVFRKCVVFYSAISTERPPVQFEFDNIRNISKMQIKRDLEPVLRKGERFALDEVSRAVQDFLSCTLDVKENEILFLKNFSDGNYMPELVFPDGADNLSLHPMALWKCRNNQ